MRFEPDTRSKIERFWDDSRSMAWILVIVAILASIWVHSRPIPGLSIGLLALMAGIMSVRPKMHFVEKIAWVLLLSGLAGFEVNALISTDAASTSDKKDLIGKLLHIQGTLDTTLRELNVVKDGISTMIQNTGVANVVPPKRPQGAKPIPESGRRHISAEDLGIYLKGKETSSASVWNDGTKRGTSLISW